MSTDGPRLGAIRQTYKPALASATKKPASPLTPRLAPNTTPTTTTRPTSPKRLTIRTPRGNETATSAPLGSTSRPTPPLRTSRPQDHAHTTPGTRSRPAPTDSASSTPILRTRGTPTSRAGSPLTAAATPSAPRLAVFDRTPTADGTLTSRARSALGTNGLDRATPSPLGRTSGVIAADNRNVPASSLFFRADEAMTQDSKPRRPPLTKTTSSFLYADGREDDAVSNVSGTLSLSASDFKNRLSPSLPPTSAAPFAPHASRSNTVDPPAHLADRSAPVMSQAPLPRNLVPLIPLQDAHNASQLESSLRVAKRRVQQTIPTSGPIESSARLPVSPGHMKSSSVSAIIPESPSAHRKRSATMNGHDAPTGVVLDSPTAIPSPSPLQSTQRGPSNPTSPTMHVLSSPQLERSPTIPDMAADARRERKVLDLEISNSSLLAINRSLERELKKQKTELKRFRRLSRAGRFSAADVLAADDQARAYRSISQGSIGLPLIADGVGRPSSPFEEDALDQLGSEASDRSDSDANSDNDDNDDDSRTHGSTSQTGRQRAKDEARLRRDLRKHRELLLDTARTHRSLQRCLTWTEDLIKHGRKALDHASGARIQKFDADDAHNGEDHEFVTSSPEDLSCTPVDGGESDDADPAIHGAEIGIEAFVGLSGRGLWHNEVDDYDENERTTWVVEKTNRDRDQIREDEKARERERDSGIEIVRSTTS